MRGSGVGGWGLGVGVWGLGLHFCVLCLEFQVPRSIFSPGRNWPGNVRRVPAAAPPSPPPQHNPIPSRPHSLPLRLSHLSAKKDPSAASDDKKSAAKSSATDAATATSKRSRDIAAPNGPSASDAPGSKKVSRELLPLDGSASTLKKSAASRAGPQAQQQQQPKAAAQHVQQQQADDSSNAWSPTSRGGKLLA